jgi:hypothetical protein
VIKVQEGLSEVSQKSIDAPTYERFKTIASFLRLMTILDHLFKNIIKTLRKTNYAIHLEF